MDNIADRYRYQSAEIHVLLIDELTHFLQNDYEYLKTRVRAADERRLRIMAATNPGNIGHGWVRDYFIESKDPEIKRIPEELWIDPETGNSRIFIPAKVDDHPSKQFRESYLKVLNAIPDPQLRAALRDGDWRQFEGQIYTEWDREIPGEHILEKLPVQLKDCKIYIGFDWGYNDWGSMSWIAEAPANDQGVRHLYCYREIYDRQKPPTWWAQEIRNIIDHESIEFMILPHDCFSHLGGNQTIAKTFGDYDIPYVRADSQSHSAKMHRIALMHQLLEPAADGHPTLQFLHTTANHIRTIPDLPYSETKPEEISDKAEDHAFDSLTYGLMVITGGDAWIVGEQQETNRKESFYFNEQGEAVGLNIDVRKALEKTLQPEQDWRYY